jgi:hypothetical protein
VSRTSRWRLVAFESALSPDPLDREAAACTGHSGCRVVSAWRLGIQERAPRPPNAARPADSVLAPAALYPQDRPEPRWLTSFLFDEASAAPFPTALADARAHPGWDQVAWVRTYDQFSGDSAVEPGDLVGIFLARRVARMSPGEFETRYAGHADVVLSHGPLFHRYLVSAAITPGTGWDGFSEQWYATRELAREHSRQLRDGLKPAVVADARSFVGASQFFMATLADTWGDAQRFLGVK